MRKSIKGLIRKSPLGPLAVSVYRALFPPKEAALHELNTRYDEETSEVMKRVLRSDSCCIDIGAHGGSILQEMIRFSPLGTHYAFEPLPHLAAHLRTTFPTVRVFEAAVSNETGTSQFVHVENEPAYSGLRQRIYDRPDPALRPITVNVVLLDDVIQNEQSVDFIKIDIEGGEFHALLGAARTIHRCHPFIVFEAGLNSTGQYGVEPDELYQLITDQLGYQLSTMRRWLTGQSPYRQSEFRENWHNGPDFYFIAYPRESPARSAQG
jgi:FkbM family methyltransferase